MLREDNKKIFYEVGLMYRDGLGVDVNPDAASKNMISADLWGYRPAKQELDTMAQNHYGVFDEVVQETP